MFLSKLSDDIAVGNSSVCEYELHMVINCFFMTDAIYRRDVQMCGKWIRENLIKKIVYSKRRKCMTFQFLQKEIRARDKLIILRVLWRTIRCMFGWNKGFVFYLAFCIPRDFSMRGKALHKVLLARRKRARECAY